MIIPKPLQKGDTIGFFSPSSPATVFAPARFERAKAYVESHGYQLKAGLDSSTKCDTPEI